MKTENTKSGYRIVALYLQSSSFKRDSIITSDPNQRKNDLKIDIETNIKDNLIEVTETVKFISINSESTHKEVAASITMIGVFEKHGETTLELENFGNVNGAAIIFPFVREHLSSMSVKAGIGNILLPPVNFVKMNLDKKKRLEKLK